MIRGRDAAGGPAGDEALVDYYSRRAAEYDRIYERPERDADLRRLSQESWVMGCQFVDLDAACSQIIEAWTRSLEPESSHN